MKALFIILPIALLVGMLVWAFLAYRKYKKNKVVKSNLDKSFIIQLVASLSVAIASLFVLVFVPASIHQVDAGEVAVVKVWGDAKYVKTAGIHYDLWISHKYEIYDCKVQQIVTNTETYSSDGQTMDIELVIQYQLQQENAMQIAKNYGGLERLESRIETVALEKMKSVLSQKSAMVSIETRSTVSPAIEQSVREAITDDYFVDITTVVLTDISFSEAFEKTVEDKMIAEQEKLKAQYEKEKAIIQAEQALEVAKLDAEAKLAAAEGEAKALEAIAKAQANALKLKSIEAARMLGFKINETTTEEGVEYNIDFEGKTSEEIKVISDYLKYIEYLSVWNGELPDVVTGNDATILVPTPSK